MAEARVMVQVYPLVVGVRVTVGVAKSGMAAKAAPTSAGVALAAMGGVRKPSTTRWKCPVRR
jgi:hypothetical protein